MDYQLEVIVLPVTDVARSLAFYTEQVGFALDVDYQPSARVVQLTPSGSACSVQIAAHPAGERLRPVQGMYLVVTDIEAARRELLDRDVEVGVIRHKSPVDRWQGGWQPGVDPDHVDYASVADFADPDGNSWVLQERTTRPTR